MKHYNLICLFLFSMPLLAAETAEVNGITATGTCLKKVAQDRASVTLTTNILAPTSGAASKEAIKESQKLRDSIIALKLEDATLNTDGFSVYEDRQYENKKMVSKGFRSRISLTVETSNIARIGDAISAAAKLGVKDIGGLSTFVSPEKKKTEYESCLEVASKSARDKAAKLAKGSGVKLGKVLRIQEGSQQSYQVNTRSMPVMMKASAGDEEMGTPSIDTKAEDLTVSATVTFAVE